MGLRGNNLAATLCIAAFLSVATVSGAQESPADTPARTMEPQGTQEPHGTQAGPSQTGPAPAERAETGSSPADTSPPRDSLVDNINSRLRSAGGAPPADGDGETAMPRMTGISGTLIVQWVTGLVFIVALILLMGWALRKLGGRTPLLAGANMGRVLGQVYLGREGKLYYVRTAGRVLVLGATNQSIRLIAEFDESAFGERDDGESDETEPREFNADDFLSELQESSRKMAGDTGDREEDDEIVEIRNALQRLQQDVRRELREPRP